MGLCEQCKKADFTEKIYRVSIEYEMPNLEEAAQVKRACDRCGKFY